VVVAVIVLIPPDIVAVTSTVVVLSGAVVVLKSVISVWLSVFGVEAAPPATLDLIVWVKVTRLPPIDSVTICVEAVKVMVVRLPLTEDTIVVIGEPSTADPVPVPLSLALPKSVVVNVWARAGSKTVTSLSLVVVIVRVDGGNIIVVLCPEVVIVTVEPGSWRVTVSVDILCKVPTGSETLVVGLVPKMEENRVMVDGGIVFVMVKVRMPAPLLSVFVINNVVVTVSVPLRTPPFVDITVDEAVPLWPGAGIVTVIVMPGSVFVINKVVVIVSAPFNRVVVIVLVSVWEIVETTVCVLGDPTTPCGLAVIVSVLVRIKLGSAETDKESVMVIVKDCITVRVTISTVPSALLITVVVRKTVEAGPAGPGTVMVESRSTVRVTVRVISFNANEVVVPMNDAVTVSSPWVIVSTDPGTVIAETVPAKVAESSVFEAIAEFSSSVAVDLDDAKGTVTKIPGLSNEPSCVCAGCPMTEPVASSVASVDSASVGCVSTGTPLIALEAIMVPAPMVWPNHGGL
jgi:hypothetical protein